MIIALNLTNPQVSEYFYFTEIDQPSLYRN